MVELGIARMMGAMDLMDKVMLYVMCDDDGF